MSKVNDTATVNLFVNGEQAEAAMSRLRTKAQDLKKALADAVAAGDDKNAKRLQKELDKTNKELNRVESSAKGAGIVLNNLSETSIHGLRNALKYLQKELRYANPDSEAWHRYAEEIERVKGRLEELNDELEGSSSLWDKFKNWAEDTWPAIDLISRGYDAVISGLREYVDAYADMEQEMANVRKFTGMTEDEVTSLNEQFLKIDTRSAREQLNRLAQEAGRLGLSSQEDVLGFVRAADKINVALDDLGEGATLTLSKLTDIFGDKERFGVEQALLKTGSVINELSQSSSASAPYIANFAERLSGVGNQARLTVPQIMALGAVLDSTGQKVEASSTAVSQVLVRMMQDPAKYAKVAGLEVENFSRLLREDANEALLTFLETLHDAGGLEVLAPMFKDMGENGSRAIATLTTLSKNIDLVRQRQQEANVAFQEGISVDKEFAVQNGTVQAKIEKSMKRFQELRIELGEKLAPLMDHLISTTSALTRVVSIAVDFVIKCRGVIIPLATAIISYYTAVGVATFAQKAWTAAVILGKSAAFTFKYIIGLMQVGMIALTQGTKAAGAAFTLLNQTMKANPFGLVISLLSTLAVVIYNVASKTDQYAKDMEDAMKTARSFTEESLKERRELDELVGRMEGAKKGTKKYEEAKQSIINQYGKYLEGLINERGEITNLEEAYKRLTFAIRQNGKIRGIETARESVNNTFTQRMVDRVQDLRKSLENFGADPKSVARIVAAVEDQIASGNAIPDAIQNELSAIQSSFNWDHLFDRNQTPVSIFNDISSSMDEYQNRLRALDNMEVALNPGKQANDMNLAAAIHGLEKALSELDGLPGDLVGVINETGQVSLEYKTKAEIETLLQNYKWEQSNRVGGVENGNGDIDVDGPFVFNDKDTSNPDRFAEEKVWRERQEAEARISYAKGETTYAQHTEKMNQIAVDYYQKLLDREDIVGDERLSIQADYWEAVNKQTNAGNKQKIDDENNSYNETIYKLNESLRIRLSAENLSAKDREAAEKVQREAVELAELNHLARLVNMYEEGSAERLRAQQAYQTAQLNAQKRYQQEYEKQEAEYAKIKADVFGDNPQEKQQKYDVAFAALQTVYAREIAAAGDNAAEKLRIEEAFLQAQNELRRQYGLQSEEDTRNAMERGVATSVEWLNGDGGKALTGTISTLTQGMSSIFSGLSTMVQAELDIQTAAISNRYDREIQVAQGNSYKVAKLEKKKEAEIAKVKNEANKKMFAMQVIQAVAQTAQNALSAYGSAAAVPVVGYILAPIAAAMAVAAGAIQIAAIKKQQQASDAQGYSQGGFTKPGGVNEPAGIVHAGEWVASQKLLANPVARPMIEALDYAQRTNTIGSLQADDVSRSITANNSLVRISESDNGSLVMAAVSSRMSEVVAALTDRLDKPFLTVNSVTGPQGMQQAEDEYNRLIKNKSPKSKKIWN